MRQVAIKVAEQNRDFRKTTNLTIYSKISSNELKNYSSVKTRAREKAITNKKLRALTNENIQ